MRHVIGFVRIARTAAVLAAMMTIAAAGAAFAQSCYDCVWSGGGYACEADVISGYTYCQTYGSGGGETWCNKPAAPDCINWGGMLVEPGVDGSAIVAGEFPFPRPDESATGNSEIGLSCDGIIVYRRYSAASIADVRRTTAKLSI
jgi:hypothetical protein